MENVEMTSGQVDPASSASTTTENDKVAYSTYQKVLGEVKTERESRRALEAELKQIKEKQLEGSEDKNKLVDYLRNQNAELEKQIQGMNEKFELREKDYAKNWVVSAVKNKALQEGCVHPDKLMRLIDSNELNSLRIDSEYNVNSEDLEMLLSKAKKDNPFFFGEQKADVKDLEPNQEPDIQFSELSTEQKKSELLNEMFS